MSLKAKIILMSFTVISLIVYRLTFYQPIFSGKSLIIFLWLFFSLLFNISGKISISLGLISLFLCGLSLFFNHAGLALRISLYSYWFLLVGVLLEMKSRFLSRHEEKEDE